MAANPSTEQKATAQPTKKITAYDLVIGILAIFSLVILIVPLLVQLPPSYSRFVKHCRKSSLHRFFR